jgi:hypothetical protein
VVCRSVRDGIDSAGVGYAGRVARIGCKTCARGVGMGAGARVGGHFATNEDRVSCDAVIR